MKSDEKKYRGYIQRQPSCFSGLFSEFINGEGRNIAAHVRRVSRGSGIGIKPLGSMIPLTKSEHDLSHQKGESDLMPPEWFEAKADEYYQRWLDLQ